MRATEPVSSWYGQVHGDPCPDGRFHGRKEVQQPQGAAVIEGPRCSRAEDELQRLQHRHAAENKHNQSGDYAGIKEHVNMFGANEAIGCRATAGEVQNASQGGEGGMTVTRRNSG